MRIVLNEPKLILFHGDNRVALKELPDACVDSVVTDPPYELGFMGKGWDASGIAYDSSLWREVLRVLKPGGHMLAFGGTRTYHRMACAIEDAGFEIRDSLHWIYGTGFPKFLDVSKELDKREGIWRGRAGAVSNANVAMGGPNYARTPKGDPVTAAAAAAWSGWGTALKPAHEPIVMARKPLIGTVAENVMLHGTGAINIDASRIGNEVRFNPPAGNKPGGSALNMSAVGMPDDAEGRTAVGRWPANVLFDENAAAELDAQPKASEASRFFYVAKPSRAERDAGLEHLTPRTAGEATDREEGTAGLNNPRAGAGRTGGARNFHPTVKPLQLMRYLIKLVTPPGGVVLEPFAGSGTTLAAARELGFSAIGVELTEDYLPIILGRLGFRMPEAA